MAHLEVNMTWQPTCGIIQWVICSSTKDTTFINSKVNYAILQDVTLLKSEVNTKQNWPISPPSVSVTLIIEMCFANIAKMAELTPTANSNCLSSKFVVISVHMPPCCLQRPYFFAGYPGGRRLADQGEMLTVWDKNENLKKNWIIQERMHL